MKKITPADCKESLFAVRDALDVLNGKWKLQIVISINGGNHRFTQIEKSIPDLSSKVLANELKDLEEHQLIERVVHDSTPVLIEYKLLPHAESLKEVINALEKWGLKHRNVVMGK